MGQVWDAPVNGEVYGVYGVYGLNLRLEGAAGRKVCVWVKVHHVLPIVGAVMRSVWLTAPCDARMITERLKRKDVRFSQGHKTSYNTVQETLLVELKHVV